MFIQRENALKRPSTYMYIIIVLYKLRDHFKKNFNTKWHQNIHQDTLDCTF